jgi:branched-chain amino acid transport system ATP-binding protein
MTGSLSGTAVTGVEADLVVRDLFVRYGDVLAVRGISLSVPRGSVVVVLGPNGAGKTSTLRALAGGLRARIDGEVSLFGESIARRPAHRVVSRGMVLVPEGRQVIAPLTVEENLLLGAHLQRSRTRIRAKLKEVHELFPVLSDRRTSAAGVLSGGEQQMLAFGRALMAEPRVILMDEPSMGLSPIMVDRVMDAVHAINRLGTSILLVEQNAAAFRVASHALVLDQGRVVSAGTPASVRDDPLMAQAFLGRAHASETLAMKS